MTEVAKADRDENARRRNRKRGINVVAGIAALLVVLVAWTDRNDMDSSIGPVNPCTDLINPSCLGAGYTQAEAAAGARVSERAQGRYDTRAWLYALAVVLIAVGYLVLAPRWNLFKSDGEMFKELGAAGVVWLSFVGLALGAQLLAEGDSVQIPLLQACAPGVVMLIVAAIGLYKSRPALVSKASQAVS